MQKYIDTLRKSNDIGYLRDQLKINKDTPPECTMHNLYLNNVISVINTRIKELEDELEPFKTTQIQVAIS